MDSLRSGATGALLALIAGCQGGGEERWPNPSQVSTPVEVDSGDSGAELPPVREVDGVTIEVDRQVHTVLRLSWEEEAPVEEAWLETPVGPTPRRALPAGPVEQVVVGLPAEVEVPLRLHRVRAGVEEILELEARTGALPADLPEPELVVPAAPGSVAGPYVLTSVDVGPEAFFGPFYTVILNPEGRVVWYRRTSGDRMTWSAQVASDGRRLLLDETTVYSFGGTPTVSRVTLDGVEESTPIPDAFIALDELPDGGLVYARRDPTPRRHGYGFDLVHLPVGGEPRSVFACDDFMAPYSAVFWACAPNTTRYDPERGTVLYSTFETSTVMEIDLETGVLLRYLGETPGGWRFEPPEAEFRKQHAPGWTPGGELIVSAHSLDRSTQWLRVYALDESAEVAREVFSVSSEHFALYAGQAQQLPSGHYLWQLGVTGRLMELDPAGEVLWKVAWPERLVGDLTVLPDLYRFVSPAGGGQP